MISDERINELLTQADGLAPKSGSIFKSLARLIEAEVIASIDAERVKEAVGKYSVVQGKTIDQFVYYETGLPDGDYKLFLAPQPPVTCQCADPEQIIALQHASDTAEAQALDNEKLRAEVDRLTKELSNCKVIMNMACTDNEKAQAERIAAQSAALAKAKDALEGVCDSDEECQDSDGWTAAVISLEAMHEAQEALEAIAQLDGAQDGEHAQPAGDADNAIYLGIARNYGWIDWRGAPGGKRPVKDDQTIEVELVCGEKHVDRAGKFDFRWFGNYEPADIVRYRIIADEEEKESRND